MTTRVGELFAGVGLLPRALGLMLRRPRLLGLGAIPPLITSTLFVVALVTLGSQIDRIINALTPFADAWSPGVAGTFRVIVGVLLVAGAVLVMVISFSTLTLGLGAPLYDKIAEATEEQLGEAPEPVPDPPARAAARAVRQSLGLILTSLLGTIVLFFAGFIPIAGQVIAPVLSAVFGGWLLCIELVGTSFQRRGLFSVRERRAAMRRNRARVLGLSIPCFLLLAVPFLSIIVFPVATAAGTILGRELLATTPERPRG